jgi:hypothetical protein
MLPHLRTALSLNAEERSLLARAWRLLIAFSWRQKFVPIKRWRHLLGEAEAAQPIFDARVFSPQDAPQSVDALVTKAIRRAITVLPYTPSCLAQAAAGMALLQGYGRGAEVVIGLQKRDEQPGSWPAHAWLATDAGILTGGTQVDEFHPTSLFRYSPLDPA